MGTYARCEPSGEYAPSKPIGSGTFSGNRPSRSTVNNSAKREYAVRGEAKRTRFPSGVYPST